MSSKLDIRHYHILFNPRWRIYVLIYINQAIHGRIFVKNDQMKYI